MYFIILIKWRRVKMIDLDLVSLSGMMSDILNRKDVDMEKFERLKSEGKSF